MNMKISKYATELLNIVNVKRGDNVWVYSPVGAKELLLELQKQIIKRGAFADMDVFFHESIFTFLETSSVKQLGVFSNTETVRTKTCDKQINIWCNDEDQMDLSKVSPQKLRTRRKATRAPRKRLSKVPIVAAAYPTKLDAKEAGMSWKKYQEVFYRSVGTDLKKIYNKFRWLERRLDLGKEIRIVSKNTDLTVSIQGRKWISDKGIHWNLPDGELCVSPIENSVNGYITFDHKQIYEGSPAVHDLHLVFKNGKIVKLDASKGKETFKKILAFDKGAKVVGELGFGINHGITKITHDILFDEKILGTCHIAFGNGFEESGSKNTSSIHWDLVKDLRNDGTIYVDNKVVFSKGRWRK